MRAPKGVKLGKRVPEGSRRSHRVNLNQGTPEGLPIPRLGPRRLREDKATNQKERKKCWKSQEAEFENEHHDTNWTNKRRTTSFFHVSKFEQTSSQNALSCPSHS
jgi:hypothetical protein